MNVKFYNANYQSQNILSLFFKPLLSKSIPNIFRGLSLTMKSLPAESKEKPVEIKNETSVEKNTLENEIIEDNNNLLYKQRLKDFMKQIGNNENFDIKFYKTSEQTLQEYYKFITAALTYEIIDLLKKYDKKIITDDIIREAVSNFLSQADAFNVAIVELQDTISKLISHSSSTSIDKASHYINYTLPNTKIKED